MSTAHPFAKYPRFFLYLAVSTFCSMAVAQNNQSSDGTAATQVPAPANTERTNETSSPVTRNANMTTAPAGPTVFKYKECWEEKSKRVVTACGEAQCPKGTSYRNTVNKALPECNASPD